MDSQTIKGIVIMAIGSAMSYSDLVALSIIGYMLIGSGFAVLLGGLKNG